MLSLKINDFLKIENRKKYNFEQSNFRFAFYLLDKEKRIAISNFYLLCNYLDNIVDDADSNVAEKQKRLNFWKNIIDEIYENDNKNFLPLAELFNKYNVPKTLLETLINGIGMDLKLNRYNTFADLLEYCYGVASAVGLICMHIFTDNKLNKNLEQYAINLGYALQLTNIIRDIGEDFNRNYIYIPQELLHRFNYTEQDIENHIYNENFYKLMNYLFERAVYYYTEANFYIKNEDKKIVKSAEAMKNIYFELLRKIRKNNFHIYQKKIKINTFQKLFLLLKV